MNPLNLDAHTHTLASGHAYGTIREMAKEAAEKGLKLLGITEHAQGIPGTCDDIYFENLRVVPRTLFGIRLLLGSEINILDYNGKLSMRDSLAKKLDICIAGIHKHCYTVGNCEENTAAVIGAIQNPLIHIISHPDDGSVPLNYEKIVVAAKEHHTLLELNNNSLNPINHRKNAFENNVKMLNLCKAQKVPILVSSDAHDPSDIGRTDFAQEVLTATDFPENLIVNYSVEQFLNYTGIQA